MYKLLSPLALIAILAAPSVLHASPILSGHFSGQGTLTNTGTSLDFANIETGNGTQTGAFATLLSNNESASGNAILTYSPVYTPGSEVFHFGPLTGIIETFAETAPGSEIFDGTALLSAAGYADTDANITLSTRAGGPVTFSATISALPSSVPEPSTFALLGTGLLGAAGAIRRKLLLS